MLLRTQDIKDDPAASFVVLATNPVPYPILYVRRRLDLLRTLIVGSFDSFEVEGVQLPQHVEPQCLAGL